MSARNLSESFCLAFFGRPFGLPLWPGFHGVSCFGTVFAVGFGGNSDTSHPHSNNDELPMLRFDRNTEPCKLGKTGHDQKRRHDLEDRPYLSEGLIYVHAAVTCVRVVCGLVMFVIPLRSLALVMRRERPWGKVIRSAYQEMVAT